MVQKKFGRPRKKQSEATLRHRLQIMISDNDKARIDELMRLTDVPSMGQVIRDAIKHYRAHMSK